MAKRKPVVYQYETLPNPKAVRGPKAFGYGRVSTADQTTEPQIDALKKAGAEQVITDDGVSGATAGALRPGLKMLLDTMQKGDTLIVWKLDRLGRSVGDLIRLVQGFKEKGVIFKSLTEGFDMSTPAGEMMFHMLAALAQFERALITERINAGIANAKRNGVALGPKPKFGKIQVDEMRRMRAQGRTYKEIRTIFKCHRATIARLLREGL